MKKFENMVQVLSYFAEQCDMFQPLLDGIKDFKAKSELLEKKIEEADILYRRMQLNSTYLADNANFGVEILKSPESEAAMNNIDPKQNMSFEDRYNLIMSVISVGKHNYDRDKMEQLLDFYSMLNVINSMQYEKLLNMIDKQYEVEIPIPEISTYPIKEIGEKNIKKAKEDDIQKNEATLKKEK